MQHMTPHDIAAAFMAFGFLSLVIATIKNFNHRARCQRESLDEARRMQMRQRIREIAARNRGEWGTL
jgi:hypothetical protein